MGLFNLFELYTTSTVYSLDIFSDIGDFFAGIPDMIGNALKSAFDYVLENTIYKLFYLIIAGLCRIVGYLDQMFKIFSGQETVTYDGKPTYLLEVFFNNHTISNIYWGFALLGVSLAFGAAIIAVARKMFDGRDKDQRSLGQILGSLAKGLLLIVSMNAIMVATLAFSNVLMQQITFIFDYGEVLDQAPYIEFKDEQYAAMGRCLNIIANYSLSESASSTYNINSCFNEIRPDLNYLSQQGVFDFHYETVNNGKKVDTWQSVLEEIAHSANLKSDIPVDVYNEGVSKSIKNAMQVLKTNRNLRPISSYKRTYQAKTESVALDRFAFLIGTMSAAKNSQYNENPEMTDGLRSAYYYGDKSIYDFDQVRSDFSVSPGSYSYLLAYGIAALLIFELAVIIFSCGARIFMMLFLYIVGPLFFATEPLDDGEKRKQWTTAFVVQVFGVMGTVVSMRLLILFIPIVLNNKLVLFDDGTLNLLAKVILIVSGFMASRKANGVITGILANNAGMQSVTASETSAAMGSMALGKTLGAAGSAAFGVAKGGYAVGKWAYNKAQSKGDDKGSGGGGGQSSLPGSYRS